MSSALIAVAVDMFELGATLMFHHFLCVLCGASAVS